MVGTLIFVGLIVYSYFVDAAVLNELLNNFWSQYATTIVFTVVLYLVNSIWFYIVLKIFNHHIYTSGRMAIAIAGNILISFIGVFIARSIVLIGFYDKTLDGFMASEGIENYRQSVIIAVVVAVVFYIIHYYNNRQKKEIKEQKIIAGAASAKFDALKNQLDPHFLFNSLNVLNSLIEENPKQAQKFTTSLSKVYRYVLEQKNKDLIDVDEELEFARTYVQLLKMRFENSIVFEILEKSGNPEAKIVPLSLQLLLENAVKHNVATESKPLNIKVYDDNGSLVVSNNLQQKKTLKKSTGFGLRNIEQRYGILTDRKVHIEKSETDFSVRLPMLTKEISFMETQKEFIADKRYEKAKEKMEAIKGFYGNLMAYCIVIPMLATLNYQTTSFMWVLFPAVGWGYGVIRHAMGAFGYNPLWGKRWEEKKMREYMEDEQF